MQESSLVRKPSIVATECINLKSILGLTRQRSETNLSNLGLINTEPRRSRSEVRGVSCDRLTVGYHTAPGNHFENGKTRSSSPPSKTGWLRGRKRERESRNPVKNNEDVFGKTVVTGSNSKRTSSRTRNGDCRTIVDGSDGKHKNKMCSTRGSLEPRKCKTSKKGSEEDIIEEELYCEINNDTSVRGKLLEENKEVFKAPAKVLRKKGMAPKPQIPTELFKETNGDVNLNPNGEKLCESLNSVSEVIAPHLKPPRKNQTYNGRNLDKRIENRALHSVKINNLKNNEKAFSKTQNSISAQSVIAVAEIHKEAMPTSTNNKNKNIDIDKEIVKNNNINNTNKSSQNKEQLNELQQVELTENDESLPFYIDTPDYSTLDSVNCNSDNLSTEDINLLKDDIINCNTDCDENLLNPLPVIISENSKATQDVSLSSILRDSSNDNKESEPKKTVRFEKLDLIEKYKKNKAENCMDVEDDTDTPVPESKSENQSVLDVNSNNIESPNNKCLLEDCSEKLGNELKIENNCTNNMTVNVVVHNPTPQEVQTDESSTQFVVKKSFVLTIAKQEKGFKSLCATKKPEVVSESAKADQQQISVTFLCSGPPSEGWVLPPTGDHQRLRSISVPPPRSLQPVEMVTALPAIRGRSRERRSKDRQHCKKNHKTRKKGKHCFRTIVI